MSGATSGGWPYVTPTDHPLEYPAFSQQFALFAESKTTPPTLGVLVPSAGWADFGGAYAGLYVTKQGRQVIVDAMLKPTADLVLAAGGTYNVATIPAEFRPPRTVYAPVVYRLSGSTPVAGAIQATAAGVLTFTPAAAGTITAAGGYLALAMPYRSAA